jgi:hypothetical protein
METVKSGKEDVVLQRKMGFDRAPQAIDGFLDLRDLPGVGGVPDGLDERPKVLVLAGHLPRRTPQPVPQARFHLPHEKPRRTQLRLADSTAQYTANCARLVARRIEVSVSVGPSPSTLGSRAITDATPRIAGGNPPRNVAVDIEPDA